ncbi:hypothetical protein [Parafilimonas terrae]|jgi:hypothetical protein|uniref:Uncharacterized protein n=1 Tax=Parafilimonas terrae TaxID=1465490 RepID=A0A1I5YVB1_9BACT|nr:hypothetical protein [Parafilimonas terrae]SFQ48112.1 hypothetical protein SAMN05444277_11465 [Parafilimonas terrae]
MDKSKTDNDPKKEKPSQINYEDELFRHEKYQSDEIDSDGSASAFDETETVDEDNFDRLSEK